MKEAKWKLCLDIDADGRRYNVETAAIRTQGSNPAARTTKRNPNWFGRCRILACELSPPETRDNKQDGHVKAHDKQGDARRGLKRIKLHERVAGRLTSD